MLVVISLVVAVCSSAAVDTARHDRENSRSPRRIEVILVTKVNRQLQLMDRNLVLQLQGAGSFFYLVVVGKQNYLGLFRQAGQGLQGGL